MVIKEIKQRKNKMKVSNLKNFNKIEIIPKLVWPYVKSLAKMHTTTPDFSLNRAWHSSA